LSRSFTPAALAAFTLACACSKPTATASTSGASGTTAPGKVVATYNGGKITARGGGEGGRRQSAGLGTKKEPGRRRARAQSARGGIVKAEAAKAGLSEQDYIRKRVEEAPVQPPTEAQERQFYDRLKSGGQIPPDATFESLKDRIGAALVNQQRQAQMQKVVGE